MTIVLNPYHGHDVLPKLGMLMANTYMRIRRVIVDKSQQLINDKETHTRTNTHTHTHTDT